MPTKSQSWRFKVNLNAEIAKPDQVVPMSMMFDPHPAYLIQFS